MGHPYAVSFLECGENVLGGVDVDVVNLHLRLAAVGAQFDMDVRFAPVAQVIFACAGRFQRKRAGVF